MRVPVLVMRRVDDRVIAVRRRRTAASVRAVIGRMVLGAARWISPRMTRPRAGRSARAIGPLRWKVIAGFARRFAIQPRRQPGRPLMKIRPSMLWKTSSIRRGLPVLRPVVVMSIRWPRSSARRTALSTAVVTD